MPRSWAGVSSGFFSSCWWDSLKNFHSAATCFTLSRMASASGLPPSFRPYYLPVDIWGTAAKQELESSRQEFSRCSRQLHFGVPAIFGLPWELTPAGTGDNHFSLA